MLVIFCLFATLLGFGVPDAARAATGGCDANSAAVVHVATATELSAALDKVTPGDTVVLAAGTYNGDFTDRRPGTATAPITICGPANAVLDGGTIDSGYTLYLDGANYTTVSGVTVTHGLKGVVTDHWEHGTIDGVTVSSVGQEAIHLREFSSNDTVEGSTVYGTGLSSNSDSVHYGEGIYIGSAYENWDRYTDGKPDRCDNDRILDNRISHTTAESVDIKEGTTGGELIGNHFDGDGMNLAKGADSWVDVKGDDWTVADNTGEHSPRDGFQVHVKLKVWGRGTLFAGNTAILGNRGYGFDVFDNAVGTVVRCNNHVIGKDAAFTNLSSHCSGVRLALPKTGQPPPPGGSSSHWPILVGIALGALAIGLAVRRHSRVVAT